MLVMGFQVAYGAEDDIEIKKKGAANWGGPLHQQNNYRHRDQGFYARDGDAKAKIGHIAFRRIFELPELHVVSRRRCRMPNRSRVRSEIVPAQKYKSELKRAEAR